MGGNSKAKKAGSGGSPFSVLSFFKGSNSHSNRRSGRREDQGGDDHYTRARKVWPSEEDNVNKGRWVADPWIDSRASAFIAHFHATRVSESELQVFHPPPSS